MSDRLFCRCGREVRVVRLNRRTLTLGHVTNPGPDSHPVRLARTAADRTSPRFLSEGANGGREDIQRPSEASDLVRGRETPEARGASRPRTTHPSADLPSPARRRVVAGLPPAPAPRLRGALDRS